MKYNDFLKKLFDSQSKDVSLALKESSEGIMKALKDEIAQPSFYADVGELKQIEMIQGMIVVRPPQYEDKE